MRKLLAATILLGGASLAGPAAAQDYLVFRSPTGNIHCAIWTGEWAGVRCDMMELTPTYRKRPADCDLEWGQSFAVDAQGGGYLACVGDSVMDPNAFTLGYGKSVSLGAFTCSSAKTGMTCTNGQGHGFQIAKAKQKVF
ncbi:DUF6636 domain-containing protein [Neotabrizicola sp. VNH66]|uniref:DUF6636 domain-containing protein n=1 Tax=Neotabrizicola sp. VNH66 TaxID=3400918 RepID=UPI003C024573